MSIPVECVSNFVENLKQAIVQCKGGDLRDGMRMVWQEAEILRGLLKDVTKYDHVEYLEDVMMQIRRAVVDAEDEVDGYLLLDRDVVKKKGSAGFAGWGWGRKKPDQPHSHISRRQALRNVGLRIRAAGIEASRIQQTKLRRGVQARDYRVVRPLPTATPGTSSNQEEAEEAEEDVGTSLMKSLVEGPDEVQLITVVGVPGSGKTMLVKRVYQDSVIESHFEMKAFVNVSPEDDERCILLKILSCFGQTDHEMDEKQAVRSINIILKGKRYLIVLDDVRGMISYFRASQMLRDAFPNQMNGSKVVIISQNSMAATDRDVDLCFQVGISLTAHFDRVNLRMQVFKQTSCPAELQVYEKQILKSCMRKPNSIMIIAGVLLKHAERVSWWEEVARDVNNYIQPIQFTYKHLPNHLKPCFLYFAVFPAEFVIPSAKLVRLWMSEGLIEERENSSLEETAEDYLQQLADKCLVMIARKRWDGRIKACYMFDIFHSFCKKQAVEENLLLQETETRSESRYRCLAVSSIPDLTSIPTGKHTVRSLLTFAEESTAPVEVEPQLASPILNSFKLLRVLESEPIIFTAFPEDLCSLVFLKHIAIASHCSTIPSTLCALWNLQTLMIKTTSPSLEIKADICKMPQFRHLHTNASASLPVEEYHREAPVGENVLQTLTFISPESCTEQVFNRTPNLKKLGVRGRSIGRLFEVNGDESSLFDNIGKLHLLEVLKLVNDGDSGKLHRVPSEKSFPGQLKRLTLSHTLLDSEEMCTLGKLENLESLKLKEDAFQGQVWETRDGGFTRLKHLHIGRTDMEVWESSVDHFPQLMCLELCHCKRLQALPTDWEDYHPSLQSVVLVDTSPELDLSVREFENGMMEKGCSDFRVI